MNIKQLLILGASVLVSSVPGARRRAGDTRQIRASGGNRDQSCSGGRLKPKPKSRSRLLFASSQAFWCFTPRRIRITPLASGYLKHMLTTEAYKAHLEAPHFKKYKATTEKMVKSLKLVRTTPIMLGAKGR